MPARVRKSQDGDEASPREQPSSGTDARCGHLLAVPLVDGSYTIAHVALYDGTVVAAFFNHRRSTCDQLFDGIDEALKERPIAVLSLVTNETWPIIAIEDPMYPASMLETKKTYQAAEVRRFLEVYWGLRRWEETGIEHPYADMLLPISPTPPATGSATLSIADRKGNGRMAEGGKDAAGGTRSRRRRVKVRTGQIAAVPLLDGTHALVHVALHRHGIFTAHFDHRRQSPEELLEGIEEAMRNKLIAILAVTSDEIEDGHWPVIGEVQPLYPAKMVDQKATSYTANMSRWLFDAYYGLCAWDQMKDPRFFEKVLLPGVPVPPTVRYRRDFEKDAALAAAAAAAPIESAPEPPITDGPAEIHIEIKYPGEDLPSVELLHRRQALERTLEGAGAGEVTEAGGGGGVMDIYLRTEDVRRATPVVMNAIKDAGFEHDAKIEVTALSDPDDADE